MGNSCDTIMLPSDVTSTPSYTSDYVHSFYGFSYSDRWCVLQQPPEGHAPQWCCAGS